jgi:hypothetical protein
MLPITIRANPYPPRASDPACFSLRAIRISPFSAQAQQAFGIPSAIDDLS